MLFVLSSLTPLVSRSRYVNHSRTSPGLENLNIASTWEDVSVLIRSKVDDHLTVDKWDIYTPHLVSRGIVYTMHAALPYVCMAIRRGSGYGPVSFLPLEICRCRHHNTKQHERGALPTGPRQAAGSGPAVWRAVNRPLPAPDRRRSDQRHSGSASGVGQRPADLGPIGSCPGHGVPGTDRPAGQRRRSGIPGGCLMCR